MSVAELDSVRVMEEGMRYDPGEQVIHVVYPFRECADAQPDNFRQIRKIQANIESRVIAQGLQDDYNKEMQRMVDVGAVRPLSREERLEHKGPVH